MDLQDKETWKPVVGFEGDYEISCLGRVRSLDRVRPLKNRYGNVVDTPLVGRIIAPNWVGTRHSYAYVHLYKSGQRKAIYVHHAVLEAFVGPRPSPTHEACHGPAGSFNNRLSNLRWDTPEGNDRDVIQLGAQKGERNNAAKLTPSKVRKIRALRGSGLDVETIAGQFGITPDYVYRLAARQAWQHVE